MGLIYGRPVTYMIWSDSEFIWNETRFPVTAKMIPQSRRTVDIFADNVIYYIID